MIEEYSNLAHQFANYKDPSYPKFALFEEIGELIGKFAKLKRGDYCIDAKWHELVKKEIGDVFWCLNELCLSENRVFEDILIQAEALPNTTEIDQILQMLFHNKNMIIDYFYLINNIILKLEYSTEEILTMNINKLEDRKKRNCINGEGDNR